MKRAFKVGKRLLAAKEESWLHKKAHAPRTARHCASSSALKEPQHRCRRTEMCSVRRLFSSYSSRLRASASCSSSSSRGGRGWELQLNS